MRRTDDLRDTAGGSDPRKSEEVEAVDRISGLPDLLLLHILSFLPFRCAVRASLMLRPFRGLWRYLSSLSFEERDLHTCDSGRSGARHGGTLWNFVDHVLALHESPEIHRLRIGLYSYASISPNPNDYGGVMSSRDRFDKWIYFALKKKVKALDIDLTKCTPWGAYLCYCRVPSAVFTASSLVELNLNGSSIELGEQIQLKSLQKLSMRNVILSDEAIQNLVSGSPSLKKVALYNCSGLRVLKLEKHPSLEELNASQCGNLEEVDLASLGIKTLAITIDCQLSKIVCPNVSTLELDGQKLNGVNLNCGSSLSNVSLYFNDYGDFFLEEVEAKTILEKLRNVAYFSLANWIMLVFTRWKLMNRPRPSFGWKSVTIILDLAKWHLPGISYLLETCDFLETLTIYVYPSYNDIRATTWDQACDFDGRSYWHSIEGTSHCLAHHLKNVMICACVTEPYVIELIEFLLGNALVLETMVISTKRNFREARNGFWWRSNFDLEGQFTSERLLEFSKKVSSFQRISPRAAVHLI